MSIADKIRINAHYTRSINLERDSGSKQVVAAYIPTTRALKTLDRVDNTLGSGDMPRAWSLVGPYGSGKSSFAIFLSHLLGNPDAETTKIAQRVLRKAQPDLARRFVSRAKGRLGHCCIMLTGSPEPLAKRLLRSAGDAAEAYWRGRPGRAPAVVAKLNALEKKEQPTTGEIVNTLSELQRAVAKSGGQGVLIIVDELGKFLEYEARHYGANDIFLLQALAEHAFKGQQVPLSIFVLLHQSFDQYAKGLGEALRNEWAKVQGRYENIPFLETAEQVLRIVAAAIDHDFTTEVESSISQFARKSASHLTKVNGLPSALEEAAAVELFKRCYPLHPVSALLLPLLCQKIAQNERTLFSYLGSHEAYGFRESLSRCRNVGEWIYPWEIYEYFILNQPAALGDHITHRRWAEVVTAVDRLGDAPVVEVQLLKTIGLINIIGAQGGLKAAKQVIELCGEDQKSTKNALATLVSRSLIQYRKFSGEYRVWQGSDFDLDAAVDDEVARVGRFVLSEELSKRHTLLPIVARKYTIQTGALRYFVPRFVDAKTYQMEPERLGDPRIIFFFIEGQDDRAIFEKHVQTRFSNQDIVVEYPNGPQLREILAETLALEAIQHTSAELHTDPVAQREFKDRYSAALQMEQEFLSSVVDEPESSAWYWNGSQLEIISKRSLQGELSRVLQAVYYASPIIPNELINRDRPSSQAIGARNKLLMALIQRTSDEELGIKKYPPEKGMYKALFRASGLHRRELNGWVLTAPEIGNDPQNFSPVWTRIEKFFSESEKHPIPFTALNDELMAPPYGVKAGVLPILYIAAFIVHQNELALYEDGIYTPYFSEEQLERFARRPESFTIQRFRLEGMRASIFREYSKALYGNEPSDKTLLAIARPLVKFIADLPDYTKTTKRISKDAQKVREAFLIAKSPEKLLFHALPAALGLPDIDPLLEDDGMLCGFAQKLTEIFRELKYAYPNLLDEKRKLVCHAFNLPASYDLEQLRVAVGGLEPLKNFTVDVDGLRALIVHVSKSGGTAEEWFLALLMFLGRRKPAAKWTDADVDAVEFRLTEYSRRINDLEKLRVHFASERLRSSGNFDVMLLRTIGNRREFEEVIKIDDHVREAIRSTKDELTSLLGELRDEKLQLAVLAVIAEDLLGRRVGAACMENSSTTYNKSAKKREKC